MDRRSFIGLIGLSAIALTLPPTKTKEAYFYLRSGETLKDKHFRGLTVRVDMEPFTRIDNCTFEMLSGNKPCLICETVGGGRPEDRMVSNCTVVGECQIG